MDGLPGGLADGAWLPGRLRPDDQRALHLAAALRDLRPRAARLAPALPARPPGPAGGGGGLRALAVLLQPGEHRGLRPARLSAAALSRGPRALARLPAARRHRAAAIAADHGSGGRHRPAGRGPNRPQRRRLQRDRRGLLGSDRRRPDRGPEADLRQLPRRRPVRRHLWTGRLLRVRPLRAGRFPGAAPGTTCPPPTPPRSSSTSRRSPGSSCWGGVCGEGAAARSSESCSPSPGRRVRTPPTRWSRTPTTRSSRSPWSSPCSA